MAVEIVKMSSKGQLVVPRSIREDMGFEPGDHFTARIVKDGILFERVMTAREVATRHSRKSL